MKNYRSFCSIARSLDVFGDKWTLLIIREIALHRKSTFKEFLQMEEKIATNTLSDRLEKLTTLELITKTRSRKNKLIYHYNITEKGLDLIPVIQNIQSWSEKYLYSDSEKEILKKSREEISLN